LVSIWGSPRLGGERIGILKKILLVLVVFALSLQAILGVIGKNRQALKRSTKDLAEEWIFDSFPPGTRIAVESMGYHGPDLKVTPVIDYWIYNLNREELEKLLVERIAAGQPSVALKYFINHPPKEKFYTTTISSREIVDIDALISKGYKYVVITSATRETYASPEVKERYPEFYRARMRYYDWLKKNARPVKIFKPDSNHPGGEIIVYELP